MTRHELTRRDVLATGAAGSVGLVAGCLGGSDEPEATVESLPAPTHGPDDAPVTVAVYEDYACPHCQTFAVDVYPKLVADYVDPGDVRYEHRDFPIPVHDRWSWEAPGAARAVQDTVGVDAFFTFTKRLFADGWEGGSMAYSSSLLRTVAADVGADPDTVLEAAIAGRYRPVLEADRDAALDKGVRGTPTVVVNGSVVEGFDYQTVQSAIEAEL
ncbi:DsbA family protein [Halobaculum marinum]|uniref:DsbA family protein n=1 Tax=Halobaculum marinum TaxID=3031996 RepID=A0ABD5WUD7_9EURY|nr:thioredoxin domain-containing protein [Halobaculum sp. DT55]